MRYLKKPKGGAWALGLCAFLITPFSVADPFDPAISIVGNTSLFDSDLDLTTTTDWSANLYSVVGGVTTNGAATGVALTDTGDGFGHTAALSGDNFALTQLGGDYALSINNSSSDVYGVTLGIMFMHTADSDDGELDADARSVSELEVTDAVDSEYLFSRLTSESGQDYFDAGNLNWQDQIHDEDGDTYLGTWGDAVSFDNMELGDVRLFDVRLEGGASFDVTGVFDMDGRSFESGATYSTESHMFIFVYNVINLSTADTDGDGVVDAEDNCPLVANPTQTPSTIEEGRGVACESLPPGC